MARLPRLVVPNHLHYIIARGNNDQHIVLDDADCQHFLSSLRDSAQRSGVAIHAYVLMPSRVQLMATPSDAEGLGKLTFRISMRVTVVAVICGRVVSAQP